MSAIALAIFYLIYLPWTYLSAEVLTNAGLTWIYYFTLVLGLLFPMYYAIEKETIAWICLGLSLILNSAIWMALEPLMAIPAVIVLIVGLLFFIGPFLEERVGNWDLVKNVFHFLKGLLLVIAIYLYAGVLGIDGMIGNTSMNHIMPQFIFLGGGIMVAFAVCLLIYWRLLRRSRKDLLHAHGIDIPNRNYIQCNYIFLLRGFRELLDCNPPMDLRIHWILCGYVQLG